MSSKIDIERIADKVMEEHNQSDQFKDRFLQFYQNTVEDNLGTNDLGGLIDRVELPEEDELDGP